MALCNLLDGCVGSRSNLFLKDMWPYWLKASDDRCVKNRVLLADDLAVLSGPNMGGTFLAGNVPGMDIW